MHVTLPSRELILAFRPPRNVPNPKPHYFSFQIFISHSHRILSSVPSSGLLWPLTPRPRCHCQPPSSTSPIWPPATAPARGWNPRARRLRRRRRMDPASSSVAAELWRPPPQHHHLAPAASGPHHEASSVVTTAERSNGGRSGGSSSRRRPRRDALAAEEEPSKLASTSGTAAAASGGGGGRDSVGLAPLLLSRRIGCDPCLGWWFWPSGSWTLACGSATLWIVAFGQARYRDLLVNAVRFTDLALFLLGSGSPQLGPLSLQIEVGQSDSTELRILNLCLGCWVTCRAQFHVE
jgi:hypothetical protein